MLTEGGTFAKLEGIPSDSTTTMVFPVGVVGEII